MLLIQRDMFCRLVGAAAVGPVVLGTAELLATTQPLANLFANGVLPFGQYAFALLCALPTIFYLAGPVTSAAAIVYLYREWDRHHQIVALRMIGLTDRAIAAPGIGAAAVAMLMVAAMSLYLVPVSARAISDIRYAALQRFSLEVLVPGQMQSVTPQYSIWFRERSETGILQEVVVVDGRKPEHPAYIFAKRGYTALPGEGGREPALFLESGTQMGRDSENQDVKFISFDHLIVPLADFAAARLWRGFFEEHIGTLLDPPPDVRSDRAAYGEWLEEGHRRIIMPLLAMSYAIFALGALLRGEPRHRSLRAIVIALAVASWHVLIVVSHSLIAQRPEMIPLYYAMALIPGLIGGAMLSVPPARPTPPNLGPEADEREIPLSVS